MSIREREIRVWECDSVRPNNRPKSTKNEGMRAHYRFNESVL